VKVGNLCLAASSSRPTSGFLPLRLVNSVVDVERLDPCQESEANEHAQGYGLRSMCKASICSTWLASCGILRHLGPSAFQPGSGDRGSTSVEAVLSGRHEGSNLQAVDGRSRIGSGKAPMTNADSSPSHHIPILQFKNRQPFGQITKSGSSRTNVRSGAFFCRQ
jgi:hypothetical protein